MRPRTIAFLRELADAEPVTLRLRGDCMAPMLPSGASIRVQKRRFYLPGDVVVFRTPAGDLAAHRLLGYRRAGLVTKGDHCVDHDAPVPRSAVIGAIEGVRVRSRDRVRALAQLARIVVRRLRR